jgi:hypothetical protein
MIRQVWSLRCVVSPIPAITLRVCAPDLISSLPSPPPLLIHTLPCLALPSPHHPPTPP